MAATNKSDQQTRHEAAQELFDDKPPPCPRNLLLKLVHDKVPRVRRENGCQLTNYTASAGRGVTFKRGDKIRGREKPQAC